MTSSFPKKFANPAAKELFRYQQALRVRFERVRQGGLLTRKSPDSDRIGVAQHGIRQAITDHAKKWRWPNNLHAVRIYGEV